MESMHMLDPYCCRNDPRKKHFCILKGKKKKKRAIGQTELCTISHKMISNIRNNNRKDKSKKIRE